MPAHGTRRHRDAAATGDDAGFMGSAGIPCLPIPCLPIPMLVRFMPALSQLMSEPQVQTDFFVAPRPTFKGNVSSRQETKRRGVRPAVHRNYPYHFFALAALRACSSA